MTLIFSVAQGLMAAKAGAIFISPFLGRLDDIGAPGIKLIEGYGQFWITTDQKAEIIAVSIRSL
ncbi:transaldolase family protein [Bacillus swezeyi]|uniref:transaldolase family protein n=1 Tax=Bacillus swezeyi TaxID=1925020 RepID=UPI002E1E10A1|nr:transaldolase family protein [Bacillus swezeyi]